MRSSANGKLTVSKTVNRGSNPRDRAKRKERRAIQLRFGTAGCCSTGLDVLRVDSQRPLNDAQKLGFFIDTIGLYNWGARFRMCTFRWCLFHLKIKKECLCST